MCELQVNLLSTIMPKNLVTSDSFIGSLFISIVKVLLFGQNHTKVVLDIFKDS